VPEALEIVFSAIYEIADLEKMAGKTLSGHVKPDLS